MYPYSPLSVKLCVPVSGVRQTAGGACEVTDEDRTENGLF